ncbi:MAG: transketolase family protein [Actinobacteria bacterium]|nr:transketolase family protein [Actinomycetota bacterium]
MYQKGEMVPTRNAYGQALIELGEQTEDVVVFEADISKSTRTDGFARKFPERFFNIGVAEQNEMAIAAGAAMCGKIPFVSTYAVFASMRACEQIRTFVAYPKLNVNICPSHGGVTSANDGATHQATEDLGIIRTIPGMTVLMPADVVTTRMAVHQAAAMDGPVYIRLTRGGVPVLYDESVDFQIGKAISLQEGKDITLIAIGDMVCKALVAAEELAKEGLDTTVLDMHTIKPIDEEAIVKAAVQTGSIVTVEDHQIYGGLGSAVAEVLVEKHPVAMERIGLKNTFAESGEYEELLNKYGMDVPSIVQAAKRVISRKK